jgi:hypothetical protein
MNIRAKIFGGASSSEESVLRAKKPKGARSSLATLVVEREEARTNNSRSGDRHRVFDEFVQVIRGERTLDVQLINLSGGGAMISGARNLRLWEKVQLRLGENGTVDCVVRWVRDDRVGLEFAHETRLDCGADEQAAVLREVVRRSFPDLEFEAEDQAPQPQHSGPESRTERRHPLVWSGVLHHDYQSTPVRLRNISSTGVMIECEAPLRVGSEPLLELSDALALSATVAWVAGDQAGLRFHSPFDLYELARSRPEVTPSNWEPPAYLTTEVTSESPWGQHWGRVSLGELRQELEGYLKR